MQVEVDLVLGRCGRAPGLAAAEIVGAVARSGFFGIATPSCCRMSLNSEGLSGPRTKLERATKHIEELQPILKAFLDSRPYKIETKRDRERGLIYYLTSVGEPPAEMAAIVGDVLQNLRSALDYLAFRLVCIGVNGPVKPWEIAYPVADEATKYPSLRDRKVRGARQEAINAINATKPYPGGNDALWRIHRLNNVDKHRLLIAVGSAFRSADIGGQMSRMMAKHWAETHPGAPPLPTLSVFFNVADRMFPLKIGDELFIDAPDAEVDEQLEFRFDVAFGEPGVMDGEPIRETLRDMVDLIDRLIAGFAPFV